MIRVIIADDHALFRESLGLLLDREAGIEVVALCADGAQVVEIVRAENPDIVLMDIQLPVLSGLQATQQIMAFSAARIIGLSMHTGYEFAMGIIRAGAKGYVTKNSGVEEVFTAIDKVMKGEKYVSRDIRDTMAEHVFDLGDQTVPVKITAKELEIIKLIGEGHTSKVIAVKLDISYKTVEVHRVNIRKKLKAKNSISLVNLVAHNDFLFVP